ncbi:LisH domain-containing protein armc9 [Allomyces arbusculus]|nr:LisH domain-containing protein armc9 [Allomyces arbusculus]
MSAERQAASLVREYLQVTEHAATLATFETEHAAKGGQFLPLSPSAGANAAPRPTSAQVKHDILAHFDRGDRAQFFNLWDAHVPDAVRAADEALRLEFYSSIYFAVFPCHQHVDPNVSKLPLAATLDTFKAFLETRGAQLSKTAEFLPYYALPYLPDPSVHPAFANVFTREWGADLRRKLLDFVAVHVHVVTPSRLADLVQTVEEVQARETKLIKRHQILQADYHNLLSVAAELIGVLANSLHGVPITPEYITSVVERMQAFKRASAPTTVAARVGPKYLQYDLIRQALLNDLTASGKTKAVLLHALRMRVTAAPTPQQRRLVVKTYIDYDVLGFSSNQPALGLFTHAVPAVREQAAKLGNLLCSYFAGRVYLTSRHCTPLLKTVLNAIKTADRPATLQHSLGLLEKLSVRRAVQSVLIHADVVRFLVVGVLRDLDAVSDATLIYAAALLMNLCLRTAGRKRAAAVPEAVLAAVVPLLEHDAPLVRTYVHGILFSVLDAPQVVERARAIGLPELLACLVDVGPPHVARQIHHVLAKLKDDAPLVPVDEPDSDDDLGDGDDDAEEEGEDDDDLGGSDDGVDPMAELGVAGDEPVGDECLRQYEAQDSRSQGALVPLPTQLPRRPPSAATNASVRRRPTSSRRAMTPAPTAPAAGNGTGGATPTPTPPAPVARRPSSSSAPRSAAGGLVAAAAPAPARPAPAAALAPSGLPAPTAAASSGLPAPKPSRRRGGTNGDLAPADLVELEAAFAPRAVLARSPPAAAAAGGGL